MSIAFDADFSSLERLMILPKVVNAAETLERLKWMSEVIGASDLDPGISLGMMYDDLLCL